MSAMDLKEAMATNLRRARHAKRLTQEELADRAGGRREPQPLHKSAAQAFNEVNVDY
jgi:transcriptional regulator with XRE-family HTH domain